MEKVKEAASESKAPASPRVEQQPKLPEQKTGPQMVSRSMDSAALPPPDGTPPAARAGSILASSDSGFGAPERARLSRTLQRSVGNARIGEKLGATVQMKLTVNTPGDVYEQEAEQVAEKETQTGQAPNKDVAISPLNADGGRSDARPKLQKKEAGEVGNESDTGLESRIQSPGEGRPLPESLRHPLESGMGVDFSNVRVHDNTTNKQDADRLNAKAFTHGSDIWIGSAGSANDHKLMAHELTHVVQQTGGIQRQPADNTDQLTIGLTRTESEGAKPATNQLSEPQRPLENKPATDELSQQPNASLSPSTRADNQPPQPNQSAADSINSPGAQDVRTLPSEPGGTAAIEAATLRSSSHAIEAPAAASGSRLPLPPATRSRMETAFGHDFGHVRIHTGQSAVAAAADKKAHAFTSGAEVSFGSEEFAPHTPSGDRLIAHELTHVVQHDQGRMPAGGMLGPKHELEQEAYATEQRITAALPSIDGKLGTHHAPGSAASRYRGEPTTPEPTTGEEPADSAGHGDRSTTEADLMGSLPSVEEARAETAGPTAQAQRVLTPNAAAVPPAIPAPMPEEQATLSPVAAPAEPEIGQAGPRSLPPIQAEAAGTRASPPAQRQQPAPPMRDPEAWIEALTREGALRLEAVQNSAAASIQRIRARAESALAEARSAFDAARERFETAAQAARGEIEAFRAGGTQRISTEVTGLAAELDSNFAARSEEARRSAGEAQTRIAQTVESEAIRSVSESEARAERARGLSESADPGDENPLAEGQREIATRVSTEVAAQLHQTGQSGADEVRKAGVSRSAGIETHLNQVLQTLESGRVAAHAKLVRSESEALAALDEQAARASEEVEARRAESWAALDQQETAFGSWISEQSERECSELAAHAQQGGADLAAKIETLTESFRKAAAPVEPLFSGASAEEPGISEAQQAFNEEMARAWTTHVAPQLAEGDRLVTSFEEHASGVDEGIGRVLGDARGKLEQTTNETTAAFATLSERFGSFVERACERALTAVSDGVAGTLAEAGRAVSEHASAVATEAEQATQSIQAALDQQLGWEDQQIGRASEQITTGQARAAQEFHNLEAQARAMEAAGGSAAIARGWLGDLWDWFSDWAESTLDWFQEKLGRVWGTIIGGILRVLIYGVGLIASGAAWVVAQAFNLAWGFIWGETLIPGYGGGLFSFIGDIIAGVLVYGDIRDLFKYGIWRPITGQGPWWLNLTMFVLTLFFFAPIGGDILKAIVKGIKAGGKGAIKLLVKLLGEELAERILRRLGIEVAEEFAERLAREVGQELAERMIRELGVEGAEELLERLGKETIIALGREISPEVMRRLVNELGERTLKRLAETLGGNMIQTLSADLGREAIEKLLRSVTPEVVEELHRRLGKDVLLNLLEGLRGVVIKEYLDTLGEAALRNLGRDLDGYAVKELFDDLGSDLLRRLATDLNGATVQRLARELGAPALRELSSRLAPTVIRDLLDQLGKDLLLRFKDSLGVDGLRQITDAMRPAEFKAFVDELTPDLIEQFGARALAEVGQHLRPTEVLDLLTTPRLSTAYLRSLAEQAGAGGVLRDAATHFGSIDELGKVLASGETFSAPAAGLREFLQHCPANGWRNLDEIDNFFYHAFSSGSTWSDLIDWAEKLGRNTLGDATRVAGRAVADPTAPHFRDLVDAAGNAVRITFNLHDALHVASRHTWERFAVTPGNANALGNSMLPEAIRAADIEAIGARLLQDPAVSTLVSTLAPGTRGVARVVDGGITYEVSITLRNGVNAMTTFYPVLGAGVEQLSQDAMRAIIWLFRSK